MRHYIGRDAIERATNLWNGQAERKSRVYRSDRQHFRAFSRPLRLTEYDLRRFNALANISRAKWATGGYSIRYCFAGRLSKWVPVIKSALIMAQRINGEGAAIRLVNGLARAKPPHASKQLGVSAASKIVYFGAPHLPVFIFDRLAGTALGLVKPKRYSDWHAVAGRAYRRSRVGVGQPDLKRLKPPFPPLDWFRRRCFDILLVDVGRRILD